jgi:hypothetical protein
MVKLVAGKKITLVLRLPICLNLPYFATFGKTPVGIML